MKKTLASRILVSLFAGGVALLSQCSALSLVACETSATVSTDAGAQTATSTPRPTVVIGDESTDPAVGALSVSPLTLSPTFDVAIHDYVVRCAAGDNAMTFTVTDAAGTTSTPVTLTEDQAVNIRGYWVRCLPHDFPQLTAQFPTTDARPSDGYYLFNSSPYGVVVDVRGTPVWYTRGAAVLNLDTTAPNTISFTPNSTAPFGTDPDGKFEVHALDAKTTLTFAASGSPTDPHEFRTLPNGHRVLLTYPREPGTNLSGLGTFGTNEVMMGCQIQELAEDGSLVWWWQGSDHIDARTESLEPSVTVVNGESTVDAFHCNSVDVNADGNLLLSARQTNAVFYIDHTSGKILWKLGGTKSNLDGAQHIDIVNDPQTTFTVQHDARFLDSGHISIFDNHGVGAGVARGVEYAIDTNAGIATFVFQFLGSAPSLYEGSFRRLADGHRVIGWGYVPTDPRLFTELDEHGREVFSLNYVGKESYRAIKVPTTQLDLQLLRDQTAK